MKIYAVLVNQLLNEILQSIIANNLNWTPWGGLNQVINNLNLKKKDFKIKHIFKQLQSSLKPSVVDMYIL